MERPRVHSETKRKARKNHTCFECERAIEPGTDYMVHSGLWDGRWDSFKWCMDCQQSYEQACEDPDGFTFYYGQLHDAIEHPEYRPVLDY